MSDNSFLEQIRAAEKEAENIIEQTQADAREKLESARQQVNELLEKSRVEAEKMQLEEAGKADREAGDIIERATAEAKQDADNLITSLSGNVPAAVNKTAERIVDFSVNR